MQKDATALAGWITEIPKMQSNAVFDINTSAFSKVGRNEKQVNAQISTGIK